MANEQNPKGSQQNQQGGQQGQNPNQKPGQQSQDPSQGGVGNKGQTDPGQKHGDKRG